ncbi:unnamed protein product [Lactuca virosa]|uniref:Uncharacterized protein n=1 Tax=Lactuca virosa TaxID=75947 RepID=A0AAU9LXT1_9ASTR|nr:unnamed protein product [Lactuca virosa]
MAVGYFRMWWCAVVLAVLFAACLAAGNTDFTLGEKTTWTQRRLLGIHLNDYGEPSANKGHDPKGKVAKSPKKKSRHF